MADYTAKVVGMEKQAAIDFLHSKGLVVRIASEDGNVNRFPDGYVAGRHNLHIVDGKVTSAEEG